MDRERLGKRIKAYRKLKRYTQVELARRIDVPLTKLGRIERGTEEASGNFLKQVADTLDVATDELTMADVTEEEEH